MKKGCVLSDKIPFSNHEQAPQRTETLRRLFFTIFLSVLRFNRLRSCSAGAAAGQQIALLLLVNRLLIFHRVYLPFAFSTRCSHYIGEWLPCQVSIRLQHLRQRLFRDVPAEAAPRQHRRNALIRLARILVGLRVRRCFSRQCNRVRQLGILANRG